MIILASNSPRRKQLLEEAGVEIKIIPSMADETIEKPVAPYKAVQMLAERKAESVFNVYSTATLGADTVVVYDGEIIGKPKDEEDAKRILNLLSGKTHQVFTGVCLITSFKRYTFFVESKVTINCLSQDFIEEYVKSGKALDKAGAYGIQDGNIVKTYEGSYTNIVGLPMEKTKEILTEAGLWQEKFV